MRCPALFSCCVALALGGCARSDEQAAGDTAGASAAAATGAPTSTASITVADLAGRWNFRATPEAGADTTPTTGVLNAGTDTSTWTLNFPNRPPIKARLVAIGGDSIVTEAGPYESTRRKGARVTTSTVAHLRDGKLVGATVAHYRAGAADSVARFRFEATKAP